MIAEVDSGYNGDQCDRKMAMMLRILSNGDHYVTEEVL